MDKRLELAHGAFMIYLGIYARGVPQIAKLASIAFGALSILRALREMQNA